MSKPASDPLREWGRKGGKARAQCRTFANTNVARARPAPLSTTWLYWDTGGVPHREHGQFREYIEAWDKANCRAEQVKAYLTEHSFDVRPGVIHLGNARPLPGGWSQATQASITQEVTHDGSQGS